MYSHCKNNVLLSLSRLYLYFFPKVLWCLLCGRLCIYVYNLKDGSRRLQPPHIQCGGVRRRRMFTLDPMSWSNKEVIAQRTRQSDYNALTLSLSQRSLTVGLLYSPWWLRAHPNSGRVYAWPGNGPSLRRRNPEDSARSSSG